MLQHTGNEKPRIKWNKLVTWVKARNNTSDKQENNWKY